LPLSDHLAPTLRAWREAERHPARVDEEPAEPARRLEADAPGARPPEATLTHLQLDRRGCAGRQLDDAQRAAGQWLRVMGRPLARDGEPAEVAALAAAGAPVHAECGGLLYLCETLDGAPMCGVLPAAGAMTPRLTLGYRAAVALSPSPLHAVGDRVDGHEFHRCTVTPRAGTAPAWGWRGGEPEGFVQGGVHASFLHTHPVGDSATIHKFVSAVRGAVSRSTVGGATLQ
jgi:hypothetical protein